MFAEIIQEIIQEKILVNPENEILKVTIHTHANHSADWRGADTVMGPKGLPLAEGDFKWAVPVTICTLIK